MQVADRTLPDRVRSAPRAGPAPIPPFFAVSTVHLDARRAVVMLLGELDLMDVPDFVGCLAQIKPTVEEVTLDFAGLQFIDCSGLHVIANFARGLAEKGGSVTIRSARPDSRRLLELIKFDRHVAIQA